MKIEYYQGDGVSGPFGYCQGIYINWFLNEEDEIDFSLEEDDDWNFEEEMAEECELEYLLRNWIEEQKEKPNPIVFKQIVNAIQELTNNKGE